MAKCVFFLETFVPRVKYVTFLLQLSFSMVCLLQSIIRKKVARDFREKLCMRRVKLWSDL